MVLEEAKRAIRNAWIAGVISGTVTLVMALLAMGGSQIPGVSSTTMVDVILVFGLSYGIYRKSRACAIIMFVYFIISKVYMMFVSGRVASIGIGLIFLYFFFKGIIGTLEYHKLIKEERGQGYRL